MEGYKGFDKDFKCRGLQYEVGKELSIDKGVEDLDFDDDGLFCKYPFDVFRLYTPGTSKFAKVEATGEIKDENPNNDLKKDTIVRTNKIKICREISLNNLVYAAIEYIKGNIDSKKEQKIDIANTEKKWSSIVTNTNDYNSSINTDYKSSTTNTGNCSTAINVGDFSAATNTGFRSLAENDGANSTSANTGDYSVSTNIGGLSVAINTGDCSAATNTGFRSAVANTGDSSVSINTGNGGVAINTGFRSISTGTGENSAVTNTGDSSVASNTGNCSSSTNTGYRSFATSSGCKSIASNVGDDSVATNTGESGIAVNIGDWSAAIVTGENSIAVSTGCKGFAKGPLGSWIVISEWMCGSEVGKDGCILKDVKSFKVDGKEILPDTFYRLEDGKPVVVVDDFNEEMKEFM